MKKILSKIRWNIVGVAGTFIIAVSLILLGVAITSSILHISLGSELWALGFMAIFTGGYIVLLWRLLHVLPSLYAVYMSLYGPLKKTE